MVSKETVMIAANLAGVAKRLGAQTVLQDFDLTVETGGVTALLGPNGAGKTTVAGLIIGRLRPDRGTARLFGADPRDSVGRRRLGVMLQAAGLSETLTVGEVVTLQARAYPHPVSVSEALALADVADLANRRCGALSGGQARRVQFALAVCGRPDFLVLDEPTAAMDRDTTRRLWSAVRELADRGCGVLLTSHDLAETDVLADRVVLLNQGVIVADTTPAAMRTGVGGVVIRCRTGLSDAILTSFPGARSVTREGADAVLRTENATPTLAALISADPSVSAVRVADATLADAIDALSSSLRVERIAA